MSSDVERDPDRDIVELAAKVARGVIATMGSGTWVSAERVR
ncbi:hypothetical protein ACFQPA_20230 [Halomarina halobia]|uniref:Uncharacterized protein n=1 Tax=Halomarina halobia TaxID=3033386 RepID=A0ABD6AFE1_9EURY|nr:hypothetical protein [Halomarina sp. PSR21]